MPIIKYLIFTILLIPAVSLSAQCPPSTESGIHVVQKGETLYGIARAYRVPLAQLRDWNNFPESKVLGICDRLIVSIAVEPTVTPTTFSRQQLTPRSAAEISGVRQAGQYHTVRAGESVASLAKLYGYTEERFREFNNLANWQEAMVGSIIRSTECECDNNPTTPPPGATITPTQNLLSDQFAQFRSPAPTTFSRQPIMPVNTTPSVPADRNFMAPDESSMIDEINLLRSNPAAYIPYVRIYQQEYPQKFGRGVSVTAVNSLIRDLERSPRLSAVQAHPCLYQVAHTHGNYLRASGQFSHTDGRGFGPEVRTTSNCPSVQLGISRSANGAIVGNENLVAGHQTVRDAVIALLIDEGLTVPGHREVLLAPEWRYVAVKNFGTMNGMPNHFVQLFGR